MEWLDWSSFGAIVVAPAAIIPITGKVAEASNVIAINRDGKNISALDRH